MHYRAYESFIFHCQNNNDDDDGDNDDNNNNIHMVCLFTASATFLPNFGKNALGKATGLDEFSAPAALTILFLCICLVLVTFVLDERNCVPIGRSLKLVTFRLTFFSSDRLEN